ncbi:MAG: DUF5685 family protein [Hornefia sp.]|nr:DUF5685 family protein [Hornefia sp.]
MCGEIFCTDYNMIGYIEPEKRELKFREYDVYNGYYCGLCKEVGETYGQVCRMWLSDDMAFLAMFLGALTDAEDKIKYEHCILHPMKKKPVEVEAQSVKYASDMMMILRGEKFIDDLRDGDKSKWIGKLTGIARKYEKAANLHPAEAKGINDALQTLYGYEVPGKSNVRYMAEAFGKMMEIVFTGYPIAKEQELSIGSFADNLGKWLYMIDVFDDFEDDKKEKRFNPICDLGITDRNRAKDLAEPALYFYLGEILKAYELIEFKKNKDIIDNVVYLGLRRKTEEVLKGKENVKGTDSTEK